MNFVACTFKAGRPLIAADLLVCQRQSLDLMRIADELVRRRRPAGPWSREEPDVPAMKETRDAGPTALIQPGIGDITASTTSWPGPRQRQRVPLPAVAGTN